MTTVSDDTTAATGEAIKFPSGGAPHPQRDRCPTCDADLMRVGLNQIVYSFEVCEDPHIEYAHIYEQLWHREHFIANAPKVGWE